MRKLVCISLVVLGLSTVSWASHIADVQILNQGDILLGDGVQAMVTASVPGVIKDVRVCKKVVLNTVEVNIYVKLACGPCQVLHRPIRMEPQCAGLNMVSVKVYYTYSHCCSCCYCPCHTASCLPMICAIGMNTFTVSQPCCCQPWWWYCM